MAKTAIITGASRGIGKAIALALAKSGMNIVINYVSNADAAEQTAQEIRSLGVSALPVQADVSDFSAAGELVKQTLDTFGRIDVLVNNAGITRDGIFARMSEEAFDAVLNTNLKSAFNCSRHVIPLMMKQRSGRIINISSIAGVIGNAGQANYAASKAGVIGLTKALAREVAKRGITVNAIAPGFIETDMTKNLPSSVTEKMGELIPMGRMGHAEEIGSAAAFLAGDGAGYITGQVLIIDGGMAI